MNKEHYDYVIIGIISCFFCFFPFGMIAIYYAHNANKEYYEKRNFKEAKIKNKIAEMMIIASFLTGIIIIVCFILIITNNNNNLFNNKFFYKFN